MPLSAGSNKWKKKRPPAGFEVVEGVLEALENELRDKVKETNLEKRKTESLWPVHQINWQKSRYVYDMFYTHHRIERPVYQYCLDQKIVDAGLIAKWKKPGYERLCSTYVINPANFKFGTTSICRVPWKDRGSDVRGVADPTTGCLGCASGGPEAGPRNIFGGKYGQNLAAVQVARDKRQALKEQKEEEKRLAAVKAAAQEAVVEQQKQAEDDDEAPTDDDDVATDDESDDDDFGPSPAAGVWAGSKKLEDESEQIADPENPDGEAPSAKKARTD
jgi:bud site selection protein 31